MFGKYPLIYLFYINLIMLLGQNRFNIIYDMTLHFGICSMYLFECGFFFLLIPFSTFVNKSLPVPVT